MKWVPRWVAIALIVVGLLVIAGSVYLARQGPSVDSVMAQIDERFGCVARRTVETARGCDLADGTVIIVDETTSDNVTDFTIAISKDNGTTGPWIIGNGFLVTVNSPSAEWGLKLELGVDLQNLVGGEARF